MGILVLFHRILEENQKSKIMDKEVKLEMANKAHEEIPGNPSTATSSKIKLNDRSNGKPLRVLSEEDWNFLDA